MAPKQKVKGSNQRFCRMFLKQRSKRASHLLWPKRRFFKMYIIIKLKARISQLRYWFHILNEITNLMWQKF